MGWLCPVRCAGPCRRPAGPFSDGSLRRSSSSLFCCAGGGPDLVRLAADTKGCTPRALTFGENIVLTLELLGGLGLLGAALWALSLWTVG
jgi:hypothetical protein